jgi:allantoin racemase
MRLLIINPNDSEAMRHTIEARCKSIALADTHIDVVCAGSGVASVEGYRDGAFAQMGVAKTIMACETSPAPYDGYLIACADDTGLYAAREIAKGPVLGIGEAAMKMAASLGYGFIIYTAQDKSVAVLEQNALLYGQERQCKGVFAANRPVLDLEQMSAEDISTTAEAILKAATGCRAESVVLGCAGLTLFHETLTQALPIPVIDGVQCGVSLLEAMVRNGLKTSKVNTFQAA